MTTTPTTTSLFTIDAHLDLSMNAMEWNRDLRRPIKEINAREQGLHDKPDRSQGTVSFPELRKGNVGLVVATQIARFVAPDNPLPGWHSPEQAWAHTQAQLAWYQAMVAAGEMVQIRDLEGLEQHLSFWNDGQDTTQKPVGFILSRLDRQRRAPRNRLCLWPARHWPCALRPRSLCQRH